jgi:hypothetical protein
MEQTHQFEYIELHVEINLSIPARIGVEGVVSETDYIRKA